MLSLRLPAPDDFSQTFWDGTRDGELLVQRCETCGAFQFYPRQHCIHCLDGVPAWYATSRTGTLYSFTTVHRTPNGEWAVVTPYVFALVDLDEGVRITCNFDDGETEPVCGMRVAIGFVERDGFHIPVARPA